MNDPVLVRKVEADFISEYQGLDLRDLWRPKSGMTVRRVIVLILELPDKSRTKQHIAGEQAIFDQKDHLLADIRDLLNASQYFAGISATKELKNSQISKVMRGMPKRIQRPSDPKEEKRFATPEELAMLFPRKALERRRRRKGLNSG